MSLGGFRYKNLLEFKSERLVYSIDREEKGIYAKMKANIAGGPYIIFNRYAKRNETTIRGGKVCKKIIGYDANALYLWALGNEMPCGRLTTVEAYEGIIEDIKADKIFGFLECDIHTPEILKQYFGEMIPIFKNVLIDCTNESVIGKHMFHHNEAHKQSRATPARKLIGSYFGEKIITYTPLLKLYLSHGMEITKTYCFVKASSHKAFAPFMEAVSNARREGDVDKSKAMIAEMMKLVGNSAFGRSGMDMSKHKEVKYESSNKTIKSKIEHFTFHGLEGLNDACEITMKKRRLNNKNPIHLSIAIYQLAKLRMLQFYYDCIEFYVDRSDFQYQEMDTDSAYIAFSCENPFQDCIKPELLAHFKEHKYDWFPRDYNIDEAKFDRRTPGLFKDEWSGDAMVSLSSKNYICYLPGESYKVKVSAKGIQQGGGRNKGVLNLDGFESVVRDRITQQGTNKGFRLSKVTKSIITYSQTKTALNYNYDKRRVLADGITTEPLDK
ncbi:putative chromodomain protein [Phytophthora cinnamomi]|uniref:putative chromodomain protein n=1 Tax=Phytophthora cinnamomi TaxID=4785 RepID=UPI003559438C|nr:putative chromodomain protein [Phytophthora cinnamomi]